MFHLIDHGTVWKLLEAPADSVDRVCSIQNVESRDVWLVDSGATCHVVSFLHLSISGCLRGRTRRSLF